MAGMLHCETNRETSRETNRRETTAPHFVPLNLARSTLVRKQSNLLTCEDIQLVHQIATNVRRNNGGDKSNEQNEHHNKSNKTCTFLNKTTPNMPTNPFRELAKPVLGKLLRFAERSWKEEGWSKQGGALEHVKGPPGSPGGGEGGGVGCLSIRIIEAWRYEVDGHLDDDRHYDGGSVLTLVTALNDDFDGGAFRTFEEDGTHKTHGLEKGDAVCFVSHKYHNVTRVERGVRNSLVIELWQGGGVGLGR